MVFIKVVEDFICDQCGKEVKGNGYTNHCPHCLWSKHVDNDPGDRESNCKGMMKPIEVENNKGTWTIIHECAICGHKKKNAVAKEDNTETLADIARERAEKLLK